MANSRLPACFSNATWPTFTSKRTPEQSEPSCTFGTAELILTIIQFLCSILIRNYISTRSRANLDITSNTSSEVSLILDLIRFCSPLKFAVHLFLPRISNSSLHPQSSPNRLRIRRVCFCNFCRGISQPPQTRLIPRSCSLRGTYRRADLQRNFEHSRGSLFTVQEFHASHRHCHSSDKCNVAWPLSDGSAH
jgi:hypothetical protein